MKGCASKELGKWQGEVAGEGRMLQRRERREQAQARLGHPAGPGSHVPVLHLCPEQPASGRGEPGDLHVATQSLKWGRGGKTTAGFLGRSPPAPQHLPPNLFPSIFRCPAPPPPFSSLLSFYFTCQMTPVYLALSLLKKPESVMIS